MYCSMSSRYVCCAESWSCWCLKAQTAAAPLQGRPTYACRCARSYRHFQSRQVAEAARRDERLQFELDTMAGEGLDVVMVDRPADGARQVSALKCTRI